MNVLGPIAALAVLGLMVAGSAAAEPPLKPYGELVVGLYEQHVDPIDDAAEETLLTTTDGAFAAVHEQGAGVAEQVDGAHGEAQAAVQVARTLDDPLYDALDTASLVATYQFGATSASLVGQVVDSLEQADAAADAAALDARAAMRDAQAQSQRSLADANRLVEETLVPVAVMGDETLRALGTLIDDARNALLPVEVEV